MENLIIKNLCPEGQEILKRFDGAEQFLTHTLFCQKCRDTAKVIKIATLQQMEDKPKQEDK